MAKSSRFVKLDDDVLLEFMYHDQSNPDLVKIENDNNGSQIKYLNAGGLLGNVGPGTNGKFLIHELGADVVEFVVTTSNGFVVINNFASRMLLLKNGSTYKFDLSDINNPAGFNIPGGNGYLSGAGTTYIYTPTTNGKYSYEYTNLAGTQFTGGEIQVSDRASSLFSVPLADTGNDIRTGAGQSGRYYAVPTDEASTWALLRNELDYLDSAEWPGTSSSALTPVLTGDVQAVWYDTIRLHLRTGYSFSGRGYDGFLFQTKVKRNSGVYNYFNSTVYLNTSNFEIQNPNPFILGESSYSKYIEIKVPSLVQMFTPATNEDFKNTFFGASGTNSIPTTANYEFDFKLIDSKVNLGGYDYINVAEGKSLILAQEDEYTDISINVEHATDGDYFKIYGTYNGNQPAFENYITGRIATSGDDITIFYEVQVAEQLGLNYINTFNNTFTQTSNYDEAIVFRPVILNSSVSSNFLLSVNMRIYNETDNTQIVKTASLIYAQPKKYGKKLLKLALNSNFAPSVVYNTLPNTSVNRELNQFVNSIRPSVGETKYVPVALDTYRIMAGSTSVTVDGATVNDTTSMDYKKEGDGIINLSKVSDNYVKFKIAQPDGDSMKSISLVNAEDLILIIKSGTIEQQISHDPSFPGVDLGVGEVFFKVPKSVAVRFDQSDTNQNADKFYINIKNGSTESLLYYGNVNII
jgi:hypothetical protein